MGFSFVEDKNLWNNFVAGQEHAQFLQSFEWGEFQKAYGHQSWRIGEKNGQKLVGAAQFFEHYLGLGMSYLYSPRGPLVEKNKISPLTKFIKEKLANYGTLFCKLESQKESALIDQKVIVTSALQPAFTLLVDLQKREEEILSYMHQKTRYNIRLAGKKNLTVKIIKGQDIQEKELADFWSLLKQTSARDEIKLHPKKYYGLMAKVLGSDNYFLHFYFFIVYFGEIPLVAGSFIGFGDTFTYIHGASSDKYREMMATYLLQWEAIKYAKAQGFKYYDFGGVNPLDKKDFEYRIRREGISRFKFGFGGTIYHFGKSYNIILKEKGYLFYSWIKKLRKIF
ncbi:MAG: Methicillin resistance protein [Candidatus Magasanikbacteria bacterium GW2011_GWC2_40_17]|uniref:Methicillin resistance protein n=1 Tax=Candidatus Magasanikbacteria bacterium GW2011_GWA2_42_32 TaxID=1619039 RepID=A0A0G1D5H6_9BACT|nr:MAG: Methicillin resistance protein [Candidatus Magasanikbacteria bacterium GW2011_GWC2_40_17]KKS57293.1 MAG: Methicillin resistance protein [Candidatus Magasanikbacteria bacterium GW2011_GWA2_42_32]OGH86179.1 MAG: hypothetical protein A2294_02930 [Candidatus Magasanikbacteria bacterium RIFOXYB2_FULL_38_10]